MALSLEYVAGLFDGEGWVRVQTPGVSVAGVINPNTSRLTPSYQVIAGIAMTYKPLMLLIYEQFGGTLNGDDHYRRKDPKNRTIYRWHLGSKKAETFFSAIVHHLVVKREQVELALKLQAHIQEHKSRMTHATDEFKSEIGAYRKDLADQITSLKKINYNLPVGHGASPYRF